MDSFRSPFGTLTCTHSLQPRLEAAIRADLVVQAATFGMAAVSAVLWLLPPRRDATRFLGAFFACCALTGVTEVLWLGSDHWSRFARHVLMSAGLACSYAFGPLIFLYVSRLGEQPAWTPGATRHLTPAILGALVPLLVYAASGHLSREVRAAIVWFASHGWLAIGVCYFLAAFATLRRARRRLEAYSADEGALGLRWLKLLLLALGFVWACLIAEAFVDPTGNEVSWFRIGSASIQFGVLLGLTVHGQRMGSLLAAAEIGAYAHSPSPARGAVAQGPPPGPGPRYARSGLGPEERARVVEDLRAHMLESRLFADSQLNLAELARATGWPANYVSQALNQHLRQNFFEFVNTFRIEEAKARLAAEQDQNVLDIAHACGFKSKSTFNAVFKRMTGLTPSEYRIGRSAATLASDPLG